MKKIIFIFILVILVGGGYFIVNGTPWSKYFVRKNVSQYLKNKYSQEMVISDVHYSFKEGIYWVSAYPTGRKDSTFRVEIRKKNTKIVDNFLPTYWENEVNSELNPIVQKVFSSRDTGRLKISGKQLDSITVDNKIPVPSFTQVRKRISSNIEIHINIHRDFISNKNTQEYQKIFEILTFIKERNYRPDYIIFKFSEDPKQIKNLKKFKCTYQDLIGISSYNQIESYVE